MPTGPGKYDQECENIILSTGAEIVVVLVINGDRGTGFSVNATASGAVRLDALPRILRKMADQIEGD